MDWISLALGVLGVVAVLVGIALVYVPAAVIALGLVLLGVAFLSLNVSPRESER